METQVEEDEIIFDHFMAALFSADMLSHATTSQVASILIKGVETRSALGPLQLTHVSLRCPQIFMSTV